jgi:hypothetical protein
MMVVRYRMMDNVIFPKKDTKLSKLNLGDLGLLSNVNILVWDAMAKYVYNAAHIMS